MITTTTNNNRFLQAFKNLYQIYKTYKKVPTDFQTIFNQLIDAYSHICTFLAICNAYMLICNVLMFDCDSTLNT